MISVKDLRHWMEQEAIGRSTTFPDGWISGEKLSELAEKVSAKEPLNYNYRDNPDYTEQVDNGVQQGELGGLGKGWSI